LAQKAKNDAPRLFCALPPQQKRRHVLPAFG